MDDLAQRRHVVAGAHVLGQLHQAVQLGRDHVHVGDAVTLDQLQGELGVPPVHQDHGVFEVRREVPERQGCHVVHRRRHQVHRVATRLDAVARQVPAEDADPGLGVERGEGALHRLGASGRARRVLHELPGHPVLRGRVGLVGQGVVEGGEAPDRPHRDAAGSGHPGLGGRGRRHVGEALVRHEGLGTRVTQDVRHLGRGEVAVQRHVVPARLVHGHQRLEHFGPVGEQGGHRIALRQAARPQGVDEAVGLRRDVAGRPVFSGWVDHGDPARFGRRRRPEPSWLLCHPYSFVGASLHRFTGPWRLTWAARARARPRCCG